jgi:hypothetical protein
VSRSARLDFSPEADDAWSYIIDHDREQAEALDKVFDRLERDASSVHAVAYDNQARLTMVRVRGRDESAIIVWRPEVGGIIRIEHVGRSRL